LQPDLFEVEGEDGYIQYRSRKKVEGGIKGAEIVICQVEFDKLGATGSASVYLNTALAQPVALKQVNLSC
jgi:hypothetical protein